MVKTYHPTSIHGWLSLGEIDKHLEDRELSSEKTYDNLIQNSKRWSNFSMWRSFDR